MKKIHIINECRFCPEHVSVVMGKEFEKGKGSDSGCSVTGKPIHTMEAFSFPAWCPKETLNVKTGENGR